MKILNTLSNEVYRALPEMPKVDLSGVTRRSATIALPAIALGAFLMAQEAEAIPYVECFENCNRWPDVHPLAQLTCQLLCFFFAEKR